MLPVVPSSCMAIVFVPKERELARHTVGLRDVSGVRRARSGKVEGGH